MHTMLIGPLFFNLSLDAITFKWALWEEHELQNTLTFNKRLQWNTSATAPTWSHDLRLTCLSNVYQVAAASRHH